MFIPTCADKVLRIYQVNNDSVLFEFASEQDACESLAKIRELGTMVFNLLRCDAIPNGVTNPGKDFH